MSWLRTHWTLVAVALAKSLVPWVGLQATVVLTFLGAHISNVVELRTKPEVVKPNTSRIVAAMKHKTTIWNWFTGEQFVRESMRKDSAKPTATLADREAAISPGVEASIERPTTNFRCVNQAVKPDGWMNWDFPVSWHSHSISHRGDV